MHSWWSVSSHFTYIAQVEMLYCKDEDAKERDNCKGEAEQGGASVRYPRARDSHVSERKMQRGPTRRTPQSSFSSHATCAERGAISVVSARLFHSFPLLLHQGSVRLRPNTLPSRTADAAYVRSCSGICSPSGICKAITMGTCEFVCKSEPPMIKKCRKPAGQSPVDL